MRRPVSSITCSSDFAKSSKTILSTKTAFNICYCKLNRKNPRVEVVNQYGQNALHLLAKKGAFDVIEVLVRKGADISKKDLNGETVVFYGLGSSHRYEILVKLFKSRSGDLNAVNKHGVS